jgi:hypothetical protein
MFLRRVWLLVSKLTASDGSSEDHFGWSVAVFNNRIVVGSPYDDDDGGGFDSGSVYVFEFDTSSSSWEEKVKLTASDAGADDGSDGFGISVAVSGDVIVVGAPYKGHAYIFEWNASTSTWNETANLVASDAKSGDLFGQSVAISKDSVIVGALFGDGIDIITGAAYFFAKDETSATWEEQAKLFASDGLFGDWFGNSVAISEDFAVVGSSMSDYSDEVLDSGAVYMYDKN